MPIVRFIKNEKQNASAMKGSIDYCLQKCKTIDSQTGQRYVSGINCNGLNAYKEFMTTKLANHADIFINMFNRFHRKTMWITIKHIRLLWNLLRKRGRDMKY